jgi:hypothetical protein
MPQAGIDRRLLAVPSLSVGTRIDEAGELHGLPGPDGSDPDDRKSWTQLQLPPAVGPCFRCSRSIVPSEGVVMRSLSLIILCLFATSTALAEAFGVWPDGSGAYPNIQAAVNAAGDGDQVVLFDGVFTGPGNWDVTIDADVEIRTNGAPGSVIIDCQQQPRAVVTEYCDPHFYGIVFRNGSATRGGSVYVDSGQPTFDHCTFEDNTATEEGGAMFIGEEAAVTLEYCTFARNHCDGDGGAIMVRGWSDLNLYRCTFLVNGADDGGHIYLLEESTLQLDRSVLAYGYGGAAVEGYYCGAITADCTDVYGNRGGDWVSALQGCAGSNHYDADPMIIDPIAGDYRMHPLSPMWATGDCGLIGAGSGADVGDEVIYGLRPQGRGMFADLETAMAEVPDRATIVLEDGEYAGAGYRDLNPGSRELTVRSRSADPITCVVDAEASSADQHRVFDLRVGDGSPLLVEGLTLQGGYMHAPYEYGGLVVIGPGVDPTFRNCDFGHAVAMEGENAWVCGTDGATISAAFIDCTFTDELKGDYWNTSLEGCSFVGADAHVHLYRNGGGTIRNCLFDGCTDIHSAGLRIRESEGTTRIISTDFVNCRATDANCGAIAAHGPHELILEGCNFTDCFANAAGSDIYASSYDGLDTMSLEGCHFIASDDPSGENGGSVYLRDMTADFNECTWDGYATTPGVGGTMYCENSTVSLLECRITNSSAYQGGAIYQEGGLLDLEAVGIYDSEANNAGGLYSRGTLYCADSSFKRNTSRGGGGAVTLSGTENNFHFDRTMFRDNASEEAAGAVFLGFGFNAADFDQCTFYANEVTGNVGVKGQIQVADQSTLQLDHTLITHSATACAVYSLPDHEPMVMAYCSNVYGNERGDWIGPLWGQLEGDENLSVDPLYCDPSGMLTVASTSPCLPDNNACSTQIGCYGQGCEVAVGVPELPLVAAGPVLHGAQPNPFNPRTTIAYDLPRDAVVTLVVHDVNGRRVRTLRSGVMESAGRHEAVWNGRDDGGRPVGSGVYLVRLAGGGSTQVQRLALIK